MSENMKESEPKSSFLYQSQEASELKLETAAASDFGRQFDGNATGAFVSRISLPQVKESAARIRSRLCKGRGIL